MNHELPKGWEEAVLDDLFSFVIGGDWGLSPETDEPNLVDTFCIRGTEFKFWDNDLGKTKVHRKITEASLEKRKLSVGDLVIEISGGGPDQPVGRVVLITPEALSVKNEYPNVCTNFMRLARPFSDMHPAYIFYYLKLFYLSGEVENYQGGSNNLRNLKFKEYCKISVPISPIAEQIRIADKLDRVLARVNAAQARLDKIPALIKRFRQSVLAAATSGELTQEWRGLNVKKGDFTTVLLGDISEVSTGVTPLKSNRSYYEDGQIPWLTSAVTGDFYVYNSEKFITNKAVDECRLKLYPPGTLLMAMYGEGKTRGQVTEIKISATVNQACAAIQIVSDSVSKEYVRLCLDDNYERTRMMAEGGAQPNLNLKKVRSIPINLPELDEQHEIVRRVESLFALADSVEKQYQDAKARTDRLTQAILAKAFRGELVPQNPDDEPAEVLLERIQAQRAAQAAIPKKSKKNAQSRAKSTTTKSGKQSSKGKNLTQPVTSSDDLLSLLKELGDEIDASALWKKSGLSIDDFYALLKRTDQIEDHNPSSDPAQRKLRVRQ